MTTPEVQSNKQASSIDRGPAFLRLALAVSAAGVVNIGLWIVVLILPNLQSDFGIERGEASLAYSAAMAGFAVGNLVLGRFVDRYGISPIMVVCGLLLAACYTASSYAPNILFFSLLQFPIGFATATGFAPLIADVSHWFQRYRGIAIATTACGNYLAGTLWPLILKDVIATDGWRPALLIVAVACIVVLLPMSFLLRRKISSHGDSASAYSRPTKKTSVSDPVLVALLALAGIGCCMAMAMPQIHIVAYAVDLGLGAETGAEMLSVMLAAGVISRLMCGFLADRIGGVATLMISSVLQYLALCLYVPFDGPTELYTVSLIFGLAQGGIVPSYAIIVREYLPPEVAGRRIGLVFLATVVGMALGGWLAGFIHDLTGSYVLAFIHGIAWNLLNIGVMTFILFRSRPARRVAAPSMAA